MSENRKNWGEGFAFGLLIGIVAAVSYFAGRPAPARASAPRLPSAIPGHRLSGLVSGEQDTRLLAESPSSSIH